MDSKLATAIDELVEKRTFGLDALGAIKGLRDKAIEQDARIDELLARVEERDQVIGGLRHEKAQVQAALDAMKAREAEMSAREAKTRDLELKEASATARATAYGEVFGTIFRNVTVRENAIRQLPFKNVQPGGYTNEGFAGVPESSERTSE
ncbi:hypothetical protein [Methylobacterium sp. yr668]|uniref:hypothetical protein n=1 Tax=Methylobacterium sp. yr668 TaxID=1761801 RepID=UPI0008DF6627|nr:hypothetical protein [Methylobacterium sp. yr668]SFT11580.1 hypothetical protein SAMN04487845_1176 [Methylobacterium sp. yr668]